MWQRTVDCLGIAVSIASDVPAIVAQLTAVLRTYADAATDPALSYELRIADWPVVVRDGQIVARYDLPFDLVAGFELDLYTRVVERAAGVVLHAAAVVGADGRAMVFAGVSGAGKSTLLRALLGRGYAYLTEECVALTGDGRCIGLARALHVEDDTVELSAGFTCDPYELRTAAGVRRTRLFHPPPERVWRTPATVAAVVALRHGPDAPDTLAQLSSGQGLVAVWPMTFRSLVTRPVDASAGLGEVPCFRLDTTTPAQAVRLASELAEELGVVPR